MRAGRDAETEAIDFWILGEDAENDAKVGRVLFVDANQGFHGMVALHHLSKKAR